MFDLLKRVWSLLVNWWMRITMMLGVCQRWSAPFWKWLAVVILLCAVAYAYGRFTGAAPEAFFRYSGMLLQFAGIATVFFDLRAAIKDLDGRTFWSGLREFAAEMRLAFRGPRTESRTVHLTGVSATTGVGSFGVQVELRGSIDDRLTNLESRTRVLEDGLTAARERHDASIAQLKEFVSTEHQAREAGDQQLQERLKGAVLGKVRLKLGGFAYLSLGVVFASVPTELAAFFFGT